MKPPFPPKSKSGSANGPSSFSASRFGKSAPAAPPAKKGKGKGPSRPSLPPSLQALDTDRDGQ